MGGSPAKDDEIPSYDFAKSPQFQAVELCLSAYEARLIIRIMFPISQWKYFQRPVLCGFLWLAVAARLPAANWPGFRGPATDGIAEKEKAPAHFGPSSNLL